LAPRVPLRVPPRVVRAGCPAPDPLAGPHRVGRRHRHPEPDRAPRALLPASRDPRAHDPGGEALGDIPVPDLLALGDARRLAGAVGARPDGALRTRQDRPRRADGLSGRGSPLSISSRYFFWPARVTSSRLAAPGRS